MSVIIAILAVALIVFIVITFLPKSGDASKNSSGDPGTGMSVPTITVETPYCVLQYPEQWKDQMTMEATSAEGLFAETFYALIAGTRYELYTVYFGNTANGELFGYLDHDGDRVPVYIECHKITDGSALSDQELSLFYSMMEGVNEVAQSIASAPGYTQP